MAAGCILVYENAAWQAFPSTHGQWQVRAEPNETDFDSVTFRDATSWLWTYAERCLWRTVTVGPVKAHFLFIYCDVYVCLVWNSGPFEIVYVRECRWRFGHMYYLLYWLWCILEEMFLVVWGVYNGRPCGRSFSWTSGEVVAVRRVGVFVLVRFA